MFERFTERARRVVVLGQEEARALGHDFIGTEHLLLGLLSEEDGVAGRVLQDLGVSLETTRTRIAELVGRSATEPGGHIPFTPRAKGVLEQALREAVRLGHNYIGTEHILLGMISKGDGVAVSVLDELVDGGSSTVERTLVDLLGQAGIPVEQRERRRGTSAVLRVGDEQRLDRIEAQLAELTDLVRRLLDERGDGASAG